MRGLLAVGDRRARHAGPLALALVAGALACASRDARAGCGDYVMVGGAHHHAVSQAPLGSRPLPECSGPHCQRRAPLSPARPQLVHAGSRDAACPPIEGRLDLVDRAATLTEPSRLFPQAMITPPDRPPRSAA